MLFHAEQGSFLCGCGFVHEGIAMLKLLTVAYELDVRPGAVSMFIALRLFIN